jgi:hypothetical protein
MNGEAIIFSAQRLMSGQHRLKAVLLAGVEVDFLIIRGVDDSAFQTLDSGKSRTLRDLLEVRQYQHSRLMQGAIVALGKMRRPTVWKKGYEQPANMLDGVETDLSGLVEPVSFVASRKQLLRLCPGGWAAAMLYVCGRKMPDAARCFFDQLASGAIDSPVHLLRERLIANVASKSRLKKETVMALMVKSWNAYSSAKPMGVLKWADEEKFPVILNAIV